MFEFYNEHLVVFSRNQKIFVLINIKKIKNLSLSFLLMFHKAVIPSLIYKKNPLKLPSVKFHSTSPWILKLWYRNFHKILRFSLENSYSIRNDLCRSQAGWTVLVCSMSRSCYIPPIRKSIKLEEPFLRVFQLRLSLGARFAYTLHVAPIKVHFCFFSRFRFCLEINLVSATNWRLQTQFFFFSPVFFSSGIIQIETETDTSRDY